MMGFEWPFIVHDDEPWRTLSISTFLFSVMFVGICFSRIWLYLLYSTVTLSIRVERWCFCKFMFECENKMPFWSNWSVSLCQATPECKNITSIYFFFIGTHSASCYCYNPHWCFIWSFSIHQFIAALNCWDYCLCKYWWKCCACTWRYSLYLSMYKDVS